VLHGHRVGAVERCDALVGEHAREQATDEAADEVGRDDVQRIVDAQVDLEASGEVAERAGGDADAERRGRSDVACSVSTGGKDVLHSARRRDRHEATYNAGACADRRKLAVEAHVHEEPGQAGRARGEVGHEDGLDRTQVGRHGTAAVAGRVRQARRRSETHKPAQPNQRRTVPRQTLSTLHGR